MVFDMVAVDRAQTVLRYWNWSLSSALTPALLRAIREGQEEAVDDYSTPTLVAPAPCSYFVGSIKCS
jgi:uncharacterized protein (DUF2336 family)